MKTSATTTVSSPTIERLAQTIVCGFPSGETVARTLWVSGCLIILATGSGIETI